MAVIWDTQICFIVLSVAISNQRRKTFVLPLLELLHSEIRGLLIVPHIVLLFVFSLF